MNKQLRPLIGILLFFTLNLCHGQGIVNVNPLTGAANIVIPIYTVNSGQVSVPITLSYTGSGVKTRDVEGTAGMGWQLNAGGQISRNVRGLPDDCTKDNTGAARLGWMSTSNTAPTYASTYSIQNNGSTCSNGAADAAAINANILYTDDTEPDMFYVNAPGLSCQLVYDRVSAQFHPVSYQDLVIAYTLVGGSGNNASLIASFTITNDMGIKYVFAAPESVTQTTNAISGTGDCFTTKLSQYSNGITFSDAWNLISITDANGNAINLSYTAATVRNSTDPLQLSIGGSTLQTQYNVLQAVTPQILSGILTSTINTSPTPSAAPCYLGFVWNAPGQYTQTGETVISAIEGMGRYFQFNYSPVKYNSTNYSRAFLTNFSDNGCGSPINYQFGYLGVNTGNNTTLLADSTSNQVDYWGYYSSSASTTSLLPSVYVNPSTGTYPRYTIDATSSPGAAYQYSLLASATRAVTPATVAYGSLNTISYADGGTTTITYQPNDYYDVPSNSTIQGGGVRVQQIVDAPVNGSGNNITRNYSYVNSSGQSTGEPITLPQFAFTVSYNGTATGQSLWTAATALSGYDLSTDDHTIMYSSVKVSQTGAGSTVYNYNIPATYWSASATPVCSGCTTTEWYPTINYAASYTCPSTCGPIANLTYSYPFIPNPNYDFERGLPSSIISYNDNGSEVSESDYSYQRSYSPTAITAFKSEDNGGTTAAKSYNKYTIFYNTSELTASVVKKVYDSNGLNQIQSNTANYTYGSTNHKLLTQQSVTNSDNSVVTTYYKYVKDYAPNSGATNANINALYNLQQLHINAPVETYQQITRGSNTVTTSAGLTLFSPSINGSVTHYLPSQQLKMVQPDGASFTPFSINTSAQTIATDPKYFVTAHIDKYDNTGYPQTIDNNYKDTVSSYFDQLSSRPTVSFKNANYNEVAFNDFDSQFAPSANTFTISGTGSFAPVGSHAGNAAGLTASTQTVTSSLITKNPVTQNYIFSIWINAATAGTLTFTGVSSPPSISYSATGWTYHEISIPASSISGSTFTLSFTSNQNISVDDILLYPDIAEATTATYDATGHYKISETNTNGVSAYYTNDQWGRVLYGFDQDHNIVVRKRYVTAASFNSFLAPTLTPPAVVYHGVPVTINNTSPNSCFTDGMTATWNFGDGTTPVQTSSFNSGIGHTFAANGTYTLTETLNSPILGSKSSSINVVVTSLPTTRISYTNTCANTGTHPASIVYVKFLQGSTVVYSFTTAQLTAGVTITPGAYTIQISPTLFQYNSATQPGGYNSVTYNGSYTQCFNYSPTIPFTLTDDLSSTPNISFTIQPTVCTSGGGEE